MVESDDDVSFESSDYASVASRTPIRFGHILSRTMSQVFPDAEEIEKGHNDDFLYSIYRRWLGNDWYGFYMFQSARRRGAFTVEIAIGRRKIYPYYWANTQPNYSVNGVRERLGAISDQQDKWWNYTSVRELQSALDNIIHYHLSSAVHTLLDSHMARLNAQVKEWVGRFNECREKVKNYSGTDSSTLFPDLPQFEEVYNYSHEVIKSRKYEKMFPFSIRSEMAKEDFILLQTFLMMEIIKDPESQNEALKEIRMMAYDYDLIGLILGRMPLENLTIESSKTKNESYLRYAFFKSVAIMETIIGLENEGRDLLANL